MRRWTVNVKWVIVGIIPLFMGLAILKLTHYQTDRDRVMQDQADRFLVEYKTVLTCMEAEALFAFKESLDQEEVLAEVLAAWHAPDEAQRDLHRRRLRVLMEPTFVNLQAARFRQFHFHFPDNTSFLRMHRPELFGDSLADIRETVVAVNRDHLPVRGFEEGRIFNAYRNVFPLSFQGEHVGSVEISFSLLGIKSTLEQMIGGRHQLIMSGKEVRQKVFAEEQSNYAAWPWSDDYLLDIEASHPHLFPDLTAVKNQGKLRSQIEAGLQAGRDFGIPLRLESRFFILQFTAIRNFTGRQVAFWVSLHGSPGLNNLRTDVYLTTAVFLFIIILLGGAILWINRVHKKLKEIASFLPICATCKKVRPTDSDSNDPRSWINIENYFDQQTDEQLTHGICPDCMRRAMKEIDG